MRRQFPFTPIILWSRHQTLAEQVLPDVVDGDTGRQRLLRRDQPAGQIQPIRFSATRDQFRKERRNTRIDFRARVKKTAPLMNAGDTLRRFQSGDIAFR